MDIDNWQNNLNIVFMNIIDFYKNIKTFTESSLKNTNVHKNENLCFHARFYPKPSHRWCHNQWIYIFWDAHATRSGNISVRLFLWAVLGPCDP